MDSHKNFFGKPLFGPGKTWEGFFLGILCAVIISLVEMLAFPYLPWQISEEVHGVKLNIVPMGPGLGLLLGLGAMLGDLVASFFKRRIGLQSGAPTPILDQDDFVVGAFFFASFVGIEFSWVILYLIITPVFHYIASLVGYRLGIKKTPW